MLLIIKGMWWWCVIFVIVFIFIIFELGFFKVLINIVFVFFWIVFLKLERLLGFINVVVIL